MHTIKINRTLKYKFVIFQDSDYTGTSTGAAGKNVSKDTAEIHHMHAILNK
jgi:hypothetical protein